jgi:hypothetical protein
MWYPPRYSADRSRGSSPGPARRRARRAGLVRTRHRAGADPMSLLRRAPLRQYAASTPLTPSRQPAPSGAPFAARSWSCPSCSGEPPALVRALSLAALALAGPPFLGPYRRSVLGRFFSCSGEPSSPVRAHSLAAPRRFGALPAPGSLSPGNQWMAQESL